MYGVISSITKKIKKVYGSISSTTRSIKKVYGVVDGVTKLIYISEIEVEYPFYLIKHTGSSNINSYLLNGTIIFPYQYDWPTSNCSNFGSYHTCRDNGSYFLTTNINSYNNGNYGLYFRCSTHFGGYSSSTHSISLSSACSTNADGSVFSGMSAAIYPPKINNSYDYLIGRNIVVNIDRGNGEYVFYTISCTVRGASYTLVSSSKGLKYIVKVDSVTHDTIFIHLFSHTCSIPVRFTSVYIE